MASQFATFLAGQGVSLKHHGVKGMRWGVRKRNPNYSDTQIKKDANIYGKRGAKRINKALNKGDQISTARSIEKTKRDTVLGRNKYARQVGKIAGAGVGIIGSQVAISALRSLPARKVGATIAFKLLGFDKGKAVFDFVDAGGRMLNTPEMRVVAAAGAATVASMLSGDLAVSINTRGHGYNPHRK